MDTGEKDPLGPEHRVNLYTGGLSELEPLLSVSSPRICASELVCARHPLLKHPVSAAPSARIKSLSAAFVSDSQMLLRGEHVTQLSVLSVSQPPPLVFVHVRL